MRGRAAAARGDVTLMRAMGMVERELRPRPGRLTLLDGEDGPASMLAHAFCAGVSIEGPAFWVDGCDAFDPHMLSRMLRHAGHNPRALLGRVHVCRAFTAHQMSAIIEESLEPALEERGPGPVLSPCLALPFMDEDLGRNEASHLLRGSMRSLQSLSRRWDIPVLVGAPAALRGTLRQACDESIVLSVRGGALRISLAGGEESLLPLAPGQTSFRGFQEA